MVNDERHTHTQKCEFNLQLVQSFQMKIARNNRDRAKCLTLLQMSEMKCRGHGRHQPIKCVYFGQDENVISNTNKLENPHSF